MIDAETLRERMMVWNEAKDKWSRLATNYCKARRIMLQFAVDDQDGRRVEEFENELRELEGMYILCLEQFRLNDSMLFTAGECVAKGEISPEYEEMERIYDSVTSSSEYISACGECEEKGRRWGLLSYADVRDKFGSRLQ